MPANDELSGANPDDYFPLCQPSVDTSYSNSLAREHAPHNLSSDGTPNPTFDGTHSQIQYPVAEIEERDIAASAVPGMVTPVS